MSTTFDCSSCGKAIAADLGPGQQVICPFCSAAVTVPGAAATPGAVPPQMPGAIVAPPQLKTGMAVTAMVLGIIGLVICFPLGLVGVVLGIIALVRVGRSPNEHGGKGMAIAGICTGAASIVTGLFISSLFLSIMLPSLARARELAKRTVCTSNLVNIGTSLVFYANVNDDKLPPDLDTLIDEMDLSSKTFLCPSAAAGYEHYIYFPVPRLNDMGPDTPIVLEDPENHGGEGGNVLFGDTHVEWVSAPKLEQMLDDAGVEKSLP